MTIALRALVTAAVLVPLGLPPARAQAPAGTAPPAPVAADAPPAPVAASAADPRQATVDRILAESLARGRAHAKLRALCAAAPERLSGSAGNAAAVEWAKAAMIADGLTEVRLEPVLVPCWVRGEKAELAVVGPEDATATSLPILALGGSVATPADGVRGELVAVESFDELRALGSAVAGKIVLFARPMDPAEPDPFAAYGKAVDQRSRGAVEAARQGAVAAIVRSMTQALDDVPHTGALRYADGVAPIPAAAVSTAGAERLVALLRAGRRPVLRLVLDCETRPDVASHNVIGEIRGTSLPEEVVLVGAHLDAWDVGTGAHDDGAGCVQAIEALRIVKALGIAPRRTLRAVLFTNEENGLRGGRAYRAAHAAEAARHVFALESDRGGFAPRGFATDANPRALEVLRGVVALFARSGATALLPGEGGADIGPLAADGVVLAELLPDAQRYFDVHHSARDTLELVHPRELELGAGLIAALVWAVADLETALPRNAPK